MVLFCYKIEFFSFTQLVVSPRTQRKPMPPTPVKKPEILVRTPDTKSIDISWDNQGSGATGRASSNLSNGHMGSVESLDASEHIRVRQDSQSREPDVVIDVPKSPPVFSDQEHHHQAALSGYETVDQMSYNSNATNSEIQAAQMNGDGEDDTASVASFASTLENVETQEYQAPPQAPAPAAPVAPAAPPALGEQAQFNFQPNEKDETNAISATPTAMLFSAAFKNPPKLKHVPQPVVKNSMVNQNANQPAPAPALTSWQPPQQSAVQPAVQSAVQQPKMNSVQAEKERIFQEQRRQEQEELDRQRQEEEQRRLEEQKQQAKFTQPSPQMGGAIEQSVPPKRDSTKDCFQNDG